MASELSESADFRRKLRERGGQCAYRCYQCATCSSVCQLAPPDAPFPRRQMLEAQWGLEDRLMADPGIWLCHQCNDCTTRCPRGAKPGDVMQVVRGLVVEALATPRFLGHAVGEVRKWWWAMLLVPIAFWVGLLAATTGLTIPEAPFAYDEFVPHVLIYAVYFSVTGLVLAALVSSGLRFWKLLGGGATRTGSFAVHLAYVIWEILIHKRFDSCGTAKSRKWGHFSLFWGFVGAAVASGLIIVAMYILHEPLPLPLAHPIKIIGNVAAVLLVVGGLILLANRLENSADTGASNAFDTFLLGLVLLVTVTGILVEAGRFLFDPQLACGLYVVHLGSVLTLFATAPYSKLAHLVYRTLAMVHERMTTPALPEAAPAEEEAAEG